MADARGAHDHMRPPYVAVVGASRASPEIGALAESVGEAAAAAGCILVCGGLGGVMEAACRGAWKAGGTTVGLLPGDDRKAANRWLSVAVATGLGELRNGLVVRAADAVIAIDGEHGTLSEIALALKIGRPVVGLGTWRLLRPDGADDSGIVPATDPREAVAVALRLCDIAGSN
jgi:uncharacterized protein (TIGR00725 family)